jgi:hypothetical protein
MATTYINSDRRADLINQYMDCWFETCSYASEETMDTEAAWKRQQLVAMNNSQLVAECNSTGWGFF